MKHDSTSEHRLRSEEFVLGAVHFHLGHSFFVDDEVSPIPFMDVMCVVVVVTSVVVALSLAMVVAAVIVSITLPVLVDMIVTPKGITFIGEVSKFVDIKEKSVFAVFSTFARALESSQFDYSLQGLMRLLTHQDRSHDWQYLPVSRYHVTSSVDILVFGFVGDDSTIVILVDAHVDVDVVVVGLCAVVTVAVVAVMFVAAMFVASMFVASMLVASMLVACMAAMGV